MLSALTSCAPSIGLSLADLDTPAGKRLARTVKTDCGAVLKDRKLPEVKRDLTEGETAAIITRRGGTAIDCAEAALAYEDHVTRVHKAVRSKLGKRR